MATTKYISICVASGCVWGAIGWFLGHKWMGEIVWGGVMVSPIIGLAVGLACQNATNWSSAIRVFASLGALYAAVAAFGFAAGIYDAFVRDIPNRITGAVILQSILGSLWGITFTGYLVLLWPLAFANLALLRKFTGGIAKGENHSPGI